MAAPPAAAPSIPSSRAFCAELAAALAHRHELFFRHAAGAAGGAAATARIAEVAVLEASIIRDLPLRPRMH